jgi:hypothetical protein
MQPEILIIIAGIIIYLTLGIRYIKTLRRFCYGFEQFTDKSKALYMASVILWLIIFIALALAYFCEEVTRD